MYIMLTYLFFMHFTHTFRQKFMIVQDLFLFDIQSCGHCEGMTPVASNSNCYDRADGCEKVVANHCHRNQDRCKKVRSEHPNSESFSFTNLRAVDFVETRLLL